MSSPPFTVSITERAERDLLRIANYYAENVSLDDALAIVDGIRTKIATLEAFPERGAIPNEVRTVEIRDFRQAIVPPFRIFYLVDARTVSVMMIADGRRDIESLLRHRLIGV